MLKIKISWNLSNNLSVVNIMTIELRKSAKSINSSGNYLYPQGNKRSAGFTDEERKSFAANFLSRGLVDTFRRQHPGVIGYTYWGYRHGGRKHNRGIYRTLLKLIFILHCLCRI